MSIFIPLNIKFIIISNKYNNNKLIFLYTFNNYISFSSKSVRVFKPSNTILINYYNCLCECVVSNYLTNYLCDWD